MSILGGWWYKWQLNPLGHSAGLGSHDLSLLLNSYHMRSGQQNVLGDKYLESVHGRGSPRPLL